MATDMDQPYREWSHEEMSGDSQDVPLCQVLDHGSISFGRFAVESLSWEKWSVFSHNRCQEEIEKFKAPGIVAQKKAYFEEYYKRIRELKALQREQDRQDTAAALGSGGDGGVCSKGGEEHNAEADDTIAVSSDRPLKEVRSNITVPRPFTFSTEKRAAAPTRTRDSSQSHSVSKASNRLDQPTGHKESMPYVQNTSVEIAVKGGMRGTSLATRRSIKPHLKGHLNQQRGHEPSPRSSLTSNDMGKKQIEVKEEEPEFRRFPQSLKSVGSQLPSFSKNGTPKSGHRKLQIIPSRCADKKGGQKSRQGMPCWR
ncbi:hypothetical protein AAC387_Pa04g2453 [Persea americana]